MNNNITVEQKQRYKYIKMIFDLIRYNSLEYNLNQEDL